MARLQLLLFELCIRIVLWTELDKTNYLDTKIVVVKDRPDRLYHAEERALECVGDLLLSRGRLIIIFSTITRLFRVLITNRISNADEIHYSSTTQEKMTSGDQTICVRVPGNCLYMYETVLETRCRLG